MEGVVGVVVILVVLVLAIKLMGLALSLVWAGVVGLAVGALARAVLPGAQNLSLIQMLGYGLAGSLIGNVIAHKVFHVGFLLGLAVEVAVAAGLITVLRNRLPKP